MLVLSRKKGELIVIGGGAVIIKVVSTGKRVKLAFAANPGVTIQRAEIADLRIALGLQEPHRLDGLMLHLDKPPIEVNQ
jgi:carbon storage regulator CsrA